MGFMWELPSPIFVEILSRLPIWTILDCRLVCKAWLDLLSDPCLVETALARQAKFMVLLTNAGFGNVADLSLHEVSSESDPKASKTIRLTSRGLNVPSNEKLQLMGCCNGLLCLRGYHPPNSSIYNVDPVIYICNPVLGEYVTIPQPIIGAPILMFGFSAVTSEYKVLRFTLVNEPSAYHPIFKPRAEVAVYTLGKDDSWRNVGIAPFPTWYAYDNLVVNGFLYWLCEAESGFEFIHSFDIAREEFRPVTPPAGLGKSRGAYKCLGVSQNSLFLIDYLGHRFDLWVMKSSHGVGESWTKICYINEVSRVWTGMSCNMHCPIVEGSKVRCYPITVWADDGILILSRFIPSSDLISNSRNASVWDDWRWVNVCYPFVPNFGSLKNIGFPECRRIVRPELGLQLGQNNPSKTRAHPGFSGAWAKHLTTLFFCLPSCFNPC